MEECRRQDLGRGGKECRKPVANWSLGRNADWEDGGDWRGLGVSTIGARYKGIDRTGNRGISATA